MDRALAPIGQAIVNMPTAMAEPEIRSKGSVTSTCSDCRLYVTKLRRSP
jgi:hypothetical protein